MKMKQWKKFLKQFQIKKKVNDNQEIKKRWLNPAKF